MLPLLLLFFTATPAAEPLELAVQPPALTLDGHKGPGKALLTRLWQSPSGMTVAEYGMHGEYSRDWGAELFVAGTWVNVGSGALFEVGKWIVTDGLWTQDSGEMVDEVPHRDSPDIGFVVSIVQDNVHARRAALVEPATGRLIFAPWNTFAPLPLAGGTKWLLLRCPRGKDGPVELLEWAPLRSVRVLGEMDVPDNSVCFSLSPADPARSIVERRAQGLFAKLRGLGMVRVAAAGPLLRPFTSLPSPAFATNGAAPAAGRFVRPLLDGRRVRGRLPGVPTTFDLRSDTLVDSWAYAGGFLFTGQGAFRVPKSAQVTWEWFDDGS